MKAAMRSSRDKGMMSPMAHRPGDVRIETIAIASLNAHYGIGRDGEPFDMRGACRSMDADVIALQEVWWPDEGADLLDEVRGAGYQVVELPQARASLAPTPDVRPGSSANTGWWGVAIASRIPLSNPQSIDIGSTPRDPVGPRKALRVQIETGAAGPITVTTLHATHIVPFAPLHHRRLARALNGSTRAVVCGDFNLWGPLAGLSFRGWQRPVRGRSYPAHRPHSQIDHLFTTADLVVTHAEVLGDVGSDHRPIVARVRTGRPA